MKRGFRIKPIWSPTKAPYHLIEVNTFFRSLFRRLCNGRKIILCAIIGIIRSPSRPVHLILLGCHVQGWIINVLSPKCTKSVSEFTQAMKFIKFLHLKVLWTYTDWHVSQFHLLWGRNVSAWLHRCSRTVEVETFGANLGFCFFFRNETMDGKVMVEGDRGTVMEWVCEFCIKLQVLSSSLSPWNPFPAALLTMPPPNPKSPLTLPVPSPC